MAHYSIVDGNPVLSEHDIAEMVAPVLDKKPFIRVVHDDDTGKNVSLKCYDSKNKRVIISNDPGLYAIYRKGIFDQYDCLYVGSGNLNSRIRRARQGVAGRLRPDEKHPGATKARRYAQIGIKDDLYIKVMSDEEKNSIVVTLLCKHYNLKNIDEHIAHILGSRFNKRVKKA